MSDLEHLSTRALADIAAADTPDALEALRVALFGKQGRVTAQMKTLGALPPLQMDPGAEPVLSHYRELARQRYGREVTADDTAWSTWP